MFKAMGLVFTFAVAMCLVGCGGSEGGTVTENAELSEIEAYEAAIAAEEAAMNEDFEETE
ncbi:hypothetical protein [Stieleria sp.]|uniref:Secreted protein n=1 Tax=Stieleria magnilauensis TaxID=2527963 RepID=A0ABX5Y4K9_9BACT|nr:hypothetical protein TBK1r_71670 [Planctomycetes bacterium TBK1r]